ncbi:MAG TPA: penicillin-binding transpeptidase domain-containing protein [Candidatus Polarisedimenticolia bacterium]|nr:penicillin-binding transpeptidase domain-containing protein [Candidatus Polarisedimenticolia bacterium]
MTATERAALRRRLRALALGLTAWAACLGARLIDLQVFRAGEMRAAAGNQQERVIRLDARRGVLYDRAGRELAVSVEVDSISANPAQIRDPARTAAALAAVLGPSGSAPTGEASSLTAKLAAGKAQGRMFVWVRRKVDPGVGAAVRAMKLEGIRLEREHKRFYPNGALAAHVLGFAGLDNQGMEGLELALDKTIRGRDGQMLAVGDARGQKFLKDMRREPVPGHGVVLALDETIQHIAERELEAAVAGTGSAHGSVVVLDPATGDVLAMASFPSYNPNRPGDADEEHRRNRAVTDAYEPGSTFKIVTLAAALEKGLLRPGDWFDCQNGAIRVSGVTLHDHKPFGSLSATEVLQESSNVGAIKIGLRLNGRDFDEAIRRFGFGVRTGIELPGEARGLLRKPEEWSGISQATMSFGQELSVTPLQLISAVAAVGNGGELRPPRLVLKELDAHGRVVAEAPARPARRVLERRTVDQLLPMMEAVVERGTAKAARMPGYSVAGKTGTAQKIGPDGTYRGNRFVASFAGFTPSRRPRLAILVVLDEPRGALYHGGDIAAPVFRRIALPALRYLGVPPEEGRLWEEGDDATLLAHAHARRWTRPIPLDEKERAAERERERKEREKQAARERRARRQERERPRPELVVPARRPLPSPRAVIAGGEVRLPDLLGYSLRKAVTYLGRAGLRARVAEGDDGSPSADGVVVEQEPPPGAIVPAGAEVALRPGRYVLMMPDEGQDEEEGRAADSRVTPVRRPMR